MIELYVMNPTKDLIGESRLKETMCWHYVSLFHWIK